MTARFFTRKTLLFVASLAIAATGIAGGAASEDETRELVPMPAMMQQHMLGNMRDHLRALEEILGLLSEGRGQEAGAVAEARLGLSSLGLHGAAHIATFMPKSMQEAGTEMHRAASRFAVLATEVEVDPSLEGQRQVFSALGEITQACNACHAGYRIR